MVSVEEYFRGEFRYRAFCQIDDGGVYCRVYVFDKSGEDRLDGIVFFQKTYAEPEIIKRIDEHFAAFLSKPIDVIRNYSRIEALLDKYKAVMNEFIRMSLQGYDQVAADPVQEQPISSGFARRAFALANGLKELDRGLYIAVNSLMASDIEKMKAYSYFRESCDASSFWCDFESYILPSKNQGGNGAK